MIAGVILAAGAGTRFGGIKQLAPFAGRPLLEHVLAVQAAAPLDERTVVLGARAEEILAAVDLHGAAPVICADWRGGQAASLRAGLRSAPEADAVVIALGDQPLLEAEAFRRVIAARGQSEAIRADYGNGVRGHPILFEAALFDRLTRLEGDSGARDLLADTDVADVACEGIGSPVDVDTPARLAALESGSP